MPRLLAIAFLPLLPLFASADLLVTIEEVGGDVVVSWSGTVDVTDLTIETASGGYGTVLIPADSVLQGGTSAAVDFYDGVTVSGPWGPGSAVTFASSNTGDAFGINTVLDPDRVMVPAGFTSGTLIGSSTYAGTDLATLGLTDGSYTVTWGGADEDGETVTILVGTAVPEPSSLGLCAIGATLLALRRRRR